MTDAGHTLKRALALGEDEEPFPWQRELLTRLVAGEVPAAIDLPTGLGKTSVMAIWLVARACGADLPRRLVYIVDRRAIVDQATDVAVRLREWAGEEDAIKESLGLRERPLPISTLRGRYVDNREWLEDPATSAIVVGTVDMIGSRLLFEGYGVSRKMRPYQAALLGVDTLLVLDESHLVPPFEDLLHTAVGDPSFRPSGANGQRVPPVRLLTLSATGRRSGDFALGLTDADCSHQTAKKRLTARKVLRIETPNDGTKLKDALAGRAWALAKRGERTARTIVYSDSRKVAQEAKRALEQLAKGDRQSGGAVQIDTELFVGARRVFERERAKERLEELGFIAGSSDLPARPAFLFATSAGEVGVDLDADHMVCDLVAWERMVQRLGRVNRRGEPEGHVAEIVVLPEEPESDDIEELLAKEPSALSAKEARAVRMWAAKEALERLPQEDGGYDASPGALLDLRKAADRDEGLGKIIDRATSPPPLRPALTRPLVEAWAMTALRKHPGRPAIRPWLRGWVEDPPQTTVVWRTYLPVRVKGEAPRSQEVEAFFEAAPPHLSEALETGSDQVAKWLKKRARGRTHAQGEDESRYRDRAVAFVLEPDRTLRKALTFPDIEGIDNKELARTLEHGTLIVDATHVAGLTGGLLDEKHAAPPSTADRDEWLGEGVVGFRVRELDASQTAAPGEGWQERRRFAREVSANGEPTRWLVVEKWRSAAANEEDRSVSPASPQLLDEHQGSVEAHAERLAERLNLSPDHRRVLALAARHHDEGKRAERWQQAFNAPQDGRVYAKTRGPIRYSLLDGYRHELGSVLRIQGNAPAAGGHLGAEDHDLMLHLIAAHHGFARPVIGTSGCEEAPPSEITEQAAEIARRFGRLQARWGPWGLAWWEALLRAADQQASRASDAGAAPGSAV